MPILHNLEGFSADPPPSLLTNPLFPRPRPRPFHNPIMMSSFEVLKPFLPSEIMVRREGNWRRKLRSSRDYSRENQPTALGLVDATYILKTKRMAACGASPTPYARTISHSHRKVRHSECFGREHFVCEDAKHIGLPQDVRIKSSVSRS